MGKSFIKTTKKEIIEYWFSKVDESELSVDAAEAHERCWRCGCEASLERCHIIPASLDGEDRPSNLVLLCHRCHLENPNVADPEIMWDWLRSYSTTYYDTFWTTQGLREYEYIYHKSLNEELKTRNIDDINEFNNLVSEQIQKTTFNYGYPYLNNATLAGVIKMTLKQIERKRIY